MKITSLIPAALLAVAVSGLPVRAQDQASAPAAPVITGTVYVAQLPTATQLMKEAETAGITITRIEPTAERVVVTYQYASGATRTYAYLPLPAGGILTGTTTGARVVEVTTVPRPAPTTTVIYTEPSRVYYSSYPRYYDPAWDFWAPLTIGVGVGWGMGNNHSHHSGGYHGGYHGRPGGGPRGGGRGRH